MLSTNETPGLAPPPTEAQGRFLRGREGEEPEGGEERRDTLSSRWMWLVHREAHSCHSPLHRVKLPKFQHWWEWCSQGPASSRGRIGTR